MRQGGFERRRVAVNDLHAGVRADKNEALFRHGSATTTRGRVRLAASVGRRGIGARHV